MGKFRVRKTETGVKFDLLATNGQVIATSQVYGSRAACLKGVNSVRVNSVAATLEDQTVEDYQAVKHPKFEVYLDKAEEFRFRLTSRNGQIIASSEGYTTHKACMNGIKSVTKNAPEAELVEVE